MNPLNESYYLKLQMSQAEAIFSVAAAIERLAQAVEKANEISLRPTVLMREQANSL